MVKNDMTDIDTMIARLMHTGRDKWKALEPFSE